MECLCVVAMYFLVLGCDAFIILLGLVLFCVAFIFCIDPTRAVRKASINKFLNPIIYPF